MSEKDPALETDGSGVTAAPPSPASKEMKKEQVPPEVGQVRPSLRAEVIIYDNWCKGCGLCVVFCPQGVLKMDRGGKVYVAAPERCTACHWCDTHCPDFAIVVQRVDKALDGRRGS